MEKKVYYGSEEESDKDTPEMGTMIRQTGTVYAKHLTHSPTLKPPNNLMRKVTAAISQRILG